MINAADKEVKLIAVEGTQGSNYTPEINEYYQDGDKMPALTNQGDSYWVYFGSVLTLGKTASSVMKSFDVT